jgi:hypothetical protein
MSVHFRLDCSRSGQAPPRERRPCITPTLIWNDGQIELGHTGEFDVIVFDLSNRVRAAEIPHCWRQISLNDRPSSGDQDKANSCVRTRSGSMKSNQMRLSRFGVSKISLMVCCPGCAARQPDSAPGTSADSMGCAVSSEVTSTWAKRSKSNQSPSGSGESLGTGVTTRLRNGHYLNAAAG